MRCPERRARRVPGIPSETTTSWNFADVWEVVADVHADRPALVWREQRLTWREFDRRADAAATAFIEAGLGAQSKVSQYLYNVPAYLESVFACFKAGLVPVNTNYRYGPDELVYLWGNADVEAVVFDVQFASRVDGLRDRVPGVRQWLCVGPTEDCPSWATPYESAAGMATAGRVVPPWGRSGDDLLLVYTGGTTGMPKGVMWRQDDLFSLLNRAGRNRYSDAVGIDDVRPKLQAPKSPPPVLLASPPLMHGTAEFTAFSTLSSGGTVVLPPEHRFDAAITLDTIERERVGEVTIVGDAYAKPLLAALDGEPDRWDISSLWLIVSSGMMFSAKVKQGLLAHNPELLCVDTLGSSEALAVATSRSSNAGSTADTATFRLGPNARVVTEDGTDVVPGSGEIGMLAVGGRLPLGYYKDGEKTAATFRVLDGKRWSVPGDFAMVEADGTVKLLGRGSVCINTGGEKVYPEEVEEVLKLHPSVTDAVVVGVPDDRFGEAVVAVVEPSRGASIDAPTLIEHVKDHLASYKAPKQVLAVTTIGRADNGKVDYKRHRDEAVERLSPASPSHRQHG
jgi:acyl-CoA synthetase (AMP-forming)/AMP-acid ligase II